MSGPISLECPPGFAQRLASKGLNGQRSREECGAHVCSARACRHHAEHHFYVQANEHVVRATDDALVFTQLHTLTVLIVS